MIKKETIKQYRFTVKELSQLDDYIVDLENNSNYDRLRHTVEYKELISLLNVRLSYCEKQCKEFEQWLTSIEDNNIKQLLFLRYVKGFSYVEITAVTSNTLAAVKMRIKRFMQINSEG